MALQSNLENLKGCVVLKVLLWLPPELKSCTSILDHMKEVVMKIQQQNTLNTLFNIRRDQKQIVGLQAKLNALVRMFHIR